MRLSTRPEIVDLGVAPFDEVHARMRSLVERIRRQETAGEVLLVEHPPVYTAGRGTPPDELPSGARTIERGGRTTFHGPGQLVVYPIVPLPRRDVRHWIGALERFGVAVCARFGLTARPMADGTGVVIGEGKVASIGVAIRHWINLHGIAINVDMDLTGFQRIRPCGLDPSVITDLSRAAGRQITMERARAAARDEVFVLLQP